MRTMRFVNEMVLRQYINIQWLSMAISKFFEIYRQRRQYQNTINELSKLSDRELRDIGLSRGQLRNVALVCSNKDCTHV